MATAPELIAGRLARQLVEHEAIEANGGADWLSGFSRSRIMRNLASAIIGSRTLSGSHVPRLEPLLSLWR